MSALHLNPMPFPEETTTPILSIEESIQRLRAEILSVDWRISEKRAELLEAAFNCLKKRFKNRKNVFAIIIMANNVLAYIRKKGESRVPATVDFLKEAMAHIVTFYEDSRLDPENDKIIFKTIYRRFILLKEKIHSEHQQNKEQQHDATTFSDNRVSEKILREAASQTLSLQQESPAAPHSRASLQPPAMQTVPPVERHQEMDRETVEALVRELKDSLQKAEELGTTIRHLLVELVSKQKTALPIMQSLLQMQGGLIEGPDNSSPGEREELPRSLPAAPASVGARTSAAGGTLGSTPTPCDRTQLLLIMFDEQLVGIEARFVAARRLLQDARRPAYLKNNTVPLKDFGRFFQSLTNQFNGCLASLKNSKLRKLSLPLLTPRGFNLPGKPMETGKEMLVLCNDNWCGILLCSPAEPGQAVMIANQQSNNGDLWKMAFTEDDRQVPLLNCLELLQREGNMILV